MSSFIWVQILEKESKPQSVQIIAAANQVLVSYSASFSHF
jgi:hypothetical protein